MSTFFRQRGSTTPQRVKQIGPSYPGRPQYTGNWVPGLVTNPVDVRTYEAMAYGIENAVNTLPAGRWARGKVLRFDIAPICPPILGFFAYDPTQAVQGH